MKKEIRKESPANRYGSANNKEKQTFTHLSKVIEECKFPIPISHRELEGTSKQKFVFVLKENAQMIHTLEFLAHKNEVKGIRIFTWGASRGSEMALSLEKLGDPKLAYGDRVYTWMTEDLTGTLTQISEIVGDIEEGTEEETE